MDLLQDAGLDVDFDNCVLKPIPPRLSPGSDNKLVPDKPVRNIVLSVAAVLWKTVISPVTLLVNVLRHIFAGRQPTADVVMPIVPSPLPMGRKTPFAGEAFEELQDALAPEYDQLRLQRGWWVLEMLPLKTKKEKAVYEATDRFADYSYM
jgi:hypothetical protein